MFCLQIPVRLFHHALITLNHFHFPNAVDDFHLDIQRNFEGRFR